MKSRSEIQIDYTEAKRRAEEIDALADRVKKLAKQNMGNVISSTSSGWHGSNGNKYNKKNSQMQDEMEKLEKKLRRMADTIRSIARRIYEAEMEAVRIAEAIRNRTVSGTSRGGSSSPSVSGHSSGGSSSGSTPVQVQPGSNPNNRNYPTGTFYA